MEHSRCKPCVGGLDTILDMRNMEIRMLSNGLSRNKTVNDLFSNFFSNASAETADNWSRLLSFAWNQLI
jgi:hypothetical protein